MAGGKEPEGEGAVPDRIKKDAPKPVLRPDGSWRAIANEVDRNVLEKQDAAKAEKKWAARIADELRNKESRSRRLGLRFKRSSEGDG